MTSRADRPIEVAVVGGGAGALAAAFELTRPELAGRYHVTVYQRGWRLGGKGASGRGPGGRIEEHGLHVWMGFYENAFRLMRECYGELARDPSRCPIARWDQAFVPDPATGVVDARARGGPSPWVAVFPPGAGMPGDPDAPVFGVPEYLVRAAQLVQTLLVSAAREAGAAVEAAPNEPDSSAALLERVSRLLRFGQLATWTGLLEAARLVQLALQAFPGGATGAPLLPLLDRFADAARAQLTALVASDDELRRIFEIVDLVLAIVRGSLRFGLASHPQGFDAIDHYDWREWLLMNGASPHSVDSSFLHSLYDLAFAYEDGDKARPRASAAVALRCAVRAFLTYRGAFFWKLTAGMGDIVFAPLYEVLSRRGVTFRFFHRLESLKLAAPEVIPAGARPWVESLEFDVQAETVSGGEYQPLVEVKGLPCWPSEPDWPQLRDGIRLRSEGVELESSWDRTRVARRTLRVSEDFDFVVLGVGLGAVPHVAPDLVSRDPRWGRMVREVKTAATQAFQVWLREPVEALGWREPPINLTGFDAEFETWADMRQLIPAEDLAETPKTIAYFCSPLAKQSENPSREAARSARERVKANALDFLNHRVGELWPGASRAGHFRFELLIDPAGSPAAAKPFDSQFWTANVDSSDRYVLSVPGSAPHRISPLDDAVDNLTVAGDWVACGLNVGCVEAAVMSGRLAAHAIAGCPSLAEITGYDHP